MKNQKNELLIAARKQSGKTQKQVAQEIGTTEVAYQRYERGTRTPSAPTGNSIARALGTTSEMLFGFKLTNVV